MAAPQPKKWSREELAADRQKAEQLFVLEREGEGVGAYRACWDEAEARVSEALYVTNDLRSINAETLSTHRGVWRTLRYFCGPPISEEDLWTLVGRKFKNLPAGVEGKAASAISRFLDAKRFPWVEAGRKPLEAEREAAAMATTTILAYESLKTQRRGVSSKAQEDQVGAALAGAGLSLDPSRASITSLDELPRGSFSRERKVAGAKCDVPVRLADGRLLALECKVSNGPKNSWKRLQREVGGKAERWRQEFGSQVVTGAVLAGSYDLSCLTVAQDEQRVAIFWQHDLQALTDFIKTTG